MKNSITILNIVFLSIAGKATAQNKLGTAINVIKKQHPVEGMHQHKYHDIEVYNEAGKGAGKEYEVLFYGKLNDTLKCYHASLQTKKNMDKAEYKWVNDTLASIFLYNSQTKKGMNFKVWGNGSGDKKTTGISLPE